MKKLSILIFALILLISLFSCGYTETPNNQKNDIDIGIDVDQAIATYKNVEEFKAFLEANGFETQIMDFEGSEITTPVDGFKKALIACNYNDTYKILFGVQEYETAELAKQMYDDPNSWKDDSQTESETSDLTPAVEEIEKNFVSKKEDVVAEEKLLSKNLIISYEVMNMYASSDEDHNAKELCMGQSVDGAKDILKKQDFANFSTSDPEQIKEILKTLPIENTDTVSNLDVYLKNLGDEHFYAITQMIEFTSKEEAISIFKKLGIEFHISLNNQFISSGIFEDFCELYNDHSGSLDLDTHVYSEKAIVCEGSHCLEEYYTLPKCPCGEVMEDIEENRTYLTPKGYHENLDEGKITTKPTCSKEGELSQTCLDCGSTVTKSVPVDPNAHVYGSTINATIEPTCTTDGLGEFYCSECKTIIDGVIPGGHVYGYVGPFFSEFSNVCSRCGVSKGSVIEGVFGGVIGGVIGGNINDVIGSMIDTYYNFSGIVVNILDLGNEYWIQVNNQTYRATISIVDNTIVICAYGVIGYYTTVPKDNTNTAQ